MTEEAWSAALGRMREEVGEDLYVFAPQEQRFFLAEGALVLLGGLLLERFVQGLGASKLGDGLQAWGNATGDWIATRFAAALGRNAAPSEEQPIPAEMRSLETVDLGAAEDVEKELAEVLVRRGMTRAKAGRVARITRQSADEFLAE
ncbi:hypothetical protein [Paractinoplanes lichenicola]|uniref:Uncharacterized protein n=1 Tax=Paractinoplanes lichenicola TaxID=2802976 RepID=A0ABS1VVL2_9ACTN|nr:hypothetical protein [Actinoplanes lichenicola]MBL7258510.1 hypothetical protein [Actinoplanes lichenicola]